MDLTFNFAEESKKLTNLEVNENCSSCDIGNFQEVQNYVMENKDINLKIPGKLFLNKFLNLTGAEISFGVLPAGMDYVSNHLHKENEEIYIVISGNGCLKAGDKEILLQEGSVVKVSTGVARALKSTQANSLIYICIQVKEGSLSNYTLSDAEMLYIKRRIDL